MLRNKLNFNNPLWDCYADSLKLCQTALCASTKATHMNAAKGGWQKCLPCTFFCCGVLNK